MKSFRDPNTGVLTAYGYVESNGDDIARDELSDFHLEPGKWKLVGDQWQPYEAPPNIQGQIDAIERQTLMNRGSRELAIEIIRREAVAKGITDDVTIAAISPFFRKLIEVDNQIRALRELL